MNLRAKELEVDGLPTSSGPRVTRALTVPMKHREAVLTLRVWLNEEHPDDVETVVLGGGMEGGVDSGQPAAMPETQPDMESGNGPATSSQSATLQMQGVDGLVAADEGAGKEVMVTEDLLRRNERLWPEAGLATEGVGLGPLRFNFEFQGVYWLGRA
ncbi:unnamed protein product [Symbiodinium microadriaticum]|nr:unnamed protein product [Symbiodinium sp. KB8]CAE7902928.1 unnamed protein product [Symbiodinium microadriaticum]